MLYCSDHGSYDVYCTVQADYESGSFILNFESMRLVSLCVAAAFWVEKDEFKYT